MKSKLVAQNVVHALLVGILAGIEIAVYAALGPAGTGLVANPLYWACFIVIPVIFMQGGEWKAVPINWLNLLLGMVVGGWLCFFFVGNTVMSLGLPLAFGIFTLITTFLVQAIATIFVPGGLKPYWGFCPMAFVGMITVFASCSDAVNMDPYITGFISLMVGVVFATLMAQSGKLAARIVGNKGETAEIAQEAEAESKAGL